MESVDSSETFYSALEIDNDSDIFLSMQESEDNDPCADILNSSDASSINSHVSIEDQTQDLVSSFMYRTYARNLSTECDQFDKVSPPRMDGIPIRTPCPHSITCLIGRELADVGDEINKRYEEQFASMFKNLLFDQVSDEQAYSTFVTVTKKLFEERITWGRIVALLCFGYYTAERLLHRGSSFFNRIIQYLVEFILKGGLGIVSWIRKQGGWFGLHSFICDSKVHSSTVVVIVIAAAAVSALAWYCSKSS